MTLFIQKQVVWFYISVDDVLRMHCIVYIYSVCVSGGGCGGGVVWGGGGGNIEARVMMCINTSN